MAAEENEKNPDGWQHEEPNGVLAFLHNHRQWFVRNQIYWVGFGQAEIRKVKYRLVTLAVFYPVKVLPRLF